MLSGDIGYGKTTLTKVTRRNWPAEQFLTGLTINPDLESSEFLQDVLYEFGITDASDTKVGCLAFLNEKMIDPQILKDILSNDELL